MIPTKYDFSFDSRACKLADLASEDRHDFQRAGFNDVTEFYGAGTDTECFVVVDYEYKTVWLVHRGTEVSNEFSWKDILTDIKFRREQDEDGFKVHRGFDEAWNEVANCVILCLREKLEEHREFRLGVTGHSLGGALACISSVDLIGFKPWLVTFGQPRVAGHYFNSYLQSGVVFWHRYVYRGDMIAHVPFAFGYRHGGDLFYIGKDRIMKSPGRWQVYGQNMLRFMRRATDHNVKNYRRRLASATVFKEDLYVKGEL